MRGLGAELDSSTEFTDSRVLVTDGTKLVELVDHIQGWCEELVTLFDAHMHHIDAIGRLSILKSLDVHYGQFDDEALLRISKLADADEAKDPV